MNLQASLDAYERNMEQMDDSLASILDRIEDSTTLVERHRHEEEYDRMELERIQVQHAWNALMRQQERLAAQGLQADGATGASPAAALFLYNQGGSP